MLTAEQVTQYEAYINKTLAIQEQLSGLITEMLDDWKSIPGLNEDEVMATDPADSYTVYNLATAITALKMVEESLDSVMGCIAHNGAWRSSQILNLLSEEERNKVLDDPSHPIFMLNRICRKAELGFDPIEMEQQMREHESEDLAEVLGSIKPEPDPEVETPSSQGN